MMKKILSPSNIVFIFLLAFLIYQQGPMIVENFKSSGMQLASREYNIVSPKTDVAKTLVFPPKNKNSIAIFWASWCGPCKIEMKRLKSSVLEGKIPTNSIVAINPFETDAEIRNFLANNHYPFTFIDAQDFARELNITSTPTTIFIKNGAISSRSSGLSLVGIWKAETFL